MPPFICLRSQVKKLADDCIKLAFKRTIIIIIIIIIMIIIIPPGMKVPSWHLAGDSYASWSGWDL